jgi:hypothetical protein
MATKFTVSLPDGTQGKRTSASRTYTHAVAVAHSVAELRDLYADEIRHYQSRLAEVQGGSRNADEYAARIASAQEKLAALEDRPADAPANWGVWGWAGRADLAEKTARQALQAYRFVQVLPVDA